MATVASGRRRPRPFPGTRSPSAADGSRPRVLSRVRAPQESQPDRARDARAATTALQHAGHKRSRRRALTGWSRTEPEVGIEPTTYRLQDGHSACTRASTCNDANCADHARRLKAHQFTPFRATSSATAAGSERRVPIGCSGVAARRAGRHPERGGQRSEGCVRPAGRAGIMVASRRSRAAWPSTPGASGGDGPTVLVSAYHQRCGTGRLCHR